MRHSSSKGRLFGVWGAFDLRRILGIWDFGIFVRGPRHSPQLLGLGSIEMCDVGRDQQEGAGWNARLITQSSFRVSFRSAM